MPRIGLADFQSLKEKFLMLGQKPLGKFITKKGRKVEIWLPSIERLPALLVFVNRLVKEDTFLTLTGQPKTIEEERLWLKSNIDNIKSGRTILVWAVYNHRIVGQCDVVRGGSRDWHTCTIGLMVDRDFRGEGIGKFLFEYILKQAKKMPGLKIAKLYIFDDNEIGKSLYQKFSFKEFARLPAGFYRRGKYSDALQMYKVLNDK